MSKTAITAPANNDGETDRFLSLIQQGIEAWKAAGKIACAQIEADPEWPDKVAAKSKFVTREMVVKFQHIGQGLLHPQLAVMSGSGPQALRRLPLAVQEKCLTEPVDLLVKTDSGWGGS